jgi:site-specific recombinase XerD
MSLARPLTVADQRTSNRSAVKASTPSSAGPTLGAALTRWYSELAAEGKSPKTLSIYRYSTDQLVASLGGHGADHRLEDIRPEDITGLIAAVRAAGKSPSTVSATFRPLRTFFLWCMAAGLLSNSPVTMKPPKVPVGIVPDIAPDQWAAMLATTDTRSRWAFRARRDRAVLLLLWTTGARLSEVAGLKVGDIAADMMSFVVHGKGGKDRTLPLLPDAAEALQAYLTLERPRSAHSGASEALWLSQGDTGVLSANGIAQMVRTRGEQAGVTGLHPHRFRHAFVSRCFAAGLSDSTIMALTGHSTHSMLSRYGQANRAQSAMDALRAIATR